MLRAMIIGNPPQNANPETTQCQYELAKAIWTLTLLHRCRLSRAHHAYPISPLQSFLPSVIFELGCLDDPLRENLEGYTWLLDEGSSVCQGQASPEPEVELICTMNGGALFIEDEVVSIIELSRSWKLVLESVQEKV